MSIENLKTGGFELSPEGVLNVKFYGEFFGPEYNAPAMECYYEDLLSQYLEAGWTYEELGKLYRMNSWIAFCEKKAESGFSACRFANGIENKRLFENFEEAFKIFEEFFDINIINQKISSLNEESQSKFYYLLKNGCDPLDLFVLLSPDYSAPWKNQKLERTMQDVKRRAEAALVSSSSPAVVQAPAVEAPVVEEVQEPKPLVPLEVSLSDSLLVTTARRFTSDRFHLIPAIAEMTQDELKEALVLTKSSETILLLARFLDRESLNQVIEAIPKGGLDQKEQGLVLQHLELMKLAFDSVPEIKVLGSWDGDCKFAGIYTPEGVKIVIGPKRQYLYHEDLLKACNLIADKGRDQDSNSFGGWLKEVDGIVQIDDWSTRFGPFPLQLMSTYLPQFNEAMGREVVLADVKE